MRRWLLMLAGLLVWTVHFLGVYGIASVAEVVDRADAPPARWTVGAFTLACIAADAAIGAAALRSLRRETDGLNRFIAKAAALAAGLSAIAVIWQGLPALVGH